MSTPFTPPANATWQTLLTELTLAYSERRQALIQSAYVPSAGKDVQLYTYWTALQSWLETYCTSFIDHVNGPLNPAGTAFLYFTLATWRAAAALNASGFRRATEWDGVTDPTWSYGQMQVGSPKPDIIAPWIFEDLQKGFGALRWTKKNGSFAGTQIIGFANGGDYPDIRYSLALLRAQAEANYVTYTPDPTTLFKSYSDSFWYKTSPDWFDAHLYRRWGNVSIITIPTFRPHALALYFLAGGPDAGTPPTEEFNTLGDFIATEDVYSLVQSVAESSDPSHTLPFGNSTKPAWCNTPLFPGSGGAFNGDHPARGYTVNGIGAILKWNFTNQTP